MSNNLIGDLRVSEIDVSGSPGKNGKVSVDIKSLVNRETKASQIRKYLKSGFDWSKFTPPVIAVFPDGREFLLDGDHRRAMFKTSFPGLGQMPCYRVHVADDKTYHKLFYEINWSNRKGANNDEVFVHQVLAEDKKALKIRDQLIAAGLCVYGSPDAHGTVGTKNAKRVTVGAFKRSVGQGTENVKLASGLLSTAWPNDEKIQGELLEAVTILFKIHNSFSDGSAVEKDFRLWFKNYVSIYTQYNAASDFKTKGGRVHHRHAESIAHGLIMGYRSATVAGGCSLQHKQRCIRASKTADLLN